MIVADFRFTANDGVPCQPGVVSECGYMFWRMRDNKALKKAHHYIINIVMIFILIIAFTIDGVMDVLK
ncbi:hypothetical protein CIK96_09420 [Prevotella sp. P4-98]|nr:hypothetical protein CIK96_09420 [Prevotella sp. P4-98]